MPAKKKAAKKVEKTPVRIKKGSLECSYVPVSYVVERLIKDWKFTLEDLEKTSIDFDYSGCYYESDTPSISVEWDDIL